MALQIRGTASLNLIEFSNLQNWGSEIGERAGWVGQKWQLVSCWRNSIQRLYMQGRTKLKLWPKEKQSTTKSFTEDRFNQIATKRIWMRAKKLVEKFGRVSEYIQRSWYLETK